MTDQHGHEHKATASVRDEVWEKQRLHGYEIFTAPYKEILSKISRPFVQKISDHVSPRASFLDGKVLMIGDALTLFRPHIAFSTSQAAFDCLQVERFVTGKIGIAEWENEVLRFGHFHWLRSIWWGQYYQSGKLYSIPSAIRYWFAVARYWFNGWSTGPQ